MLDSITAEPLTGLRQHRRGAARPGGKRTGPGDGARRPAGLSAPPQGRSPEIDRRPGQMLDARQAELGRAAGRQAAGVGAAKRGASRRPSGALRADWERPAGARGVLPGSRRDHRPGAGDRPGLRPGRRSCREAFRASVRALELPDEAALLKAMGQGELEAVVDEHDRAAGGRPARRPGRDRRRGKPSSKMPRSAPTPPECAGTPTRRREAEAEAEAATEDLARLAVADAARREWAEAHAGQAARAEAAERELRARGLAERIPVTDAEVAQASAGAGDAGHGPGALGSAQGRADRPYPG